MPRTLADVMTALPPERRARIEAETERMAADVMTLQEIRKTFRLTQTTIATTLGMEQESISRIERRADLMLSTMRDYVGALGGTLKITAEFPGNRTIEIDTLSDLGASPSQPAGSKKKRQGALPRPA